MSFYYGLVVGDLKPDMEIDISNQLTLLVGALAVELDWIRPDGTTATVPLIVVDQTNGILKRVWSAGDSALAGIHKGRVKITTSGSQIAHWPDDGTYIYWVVSPA